MVKKPKKTKKAKNFLKATFFLQDEVFTRTCVLGDAQSVFVADLYCHKPYNQEYSNRYERAYKNKSSTKSDCKQNA